MTISVSVFQASVFQYIFALFIVCMKIRVCIYEEVISTEKFPVVYGQRFTPEFELLLS